MEELCFSVVLPEKTVHVKTISLINSVFIWIGEDHLNFNNLIISSTTKFSSLPSSVPVLGDSSGTLSQKLTKKLGKQVLLSYNVEMDPLNQGFNEDMVLKEVISRLTKTVKPGS